MFLLCSEEILSHRVYHKGQGINLVLRVQYTAGMINFPENTPMNRVEKMIKDVFICPAGMFQVFLIPEHIKCC